MNDADRRVLLQLARDSIVAHVTNARPPESPPSDVLNRPGAAFVTIHADGELRGCIGHIGEPEPLGQLIARCAVSSCSADPRFPPVTRSELDRISIELSVLGPLEPISGPADFQIGRHGLVVEHGWNRGLLLPQVATEWGWDAETFLAHTCRKAGLPHDSWKRGAKLWRFEAEVFGEGE